MTKMQPWHVDRLSLSNFRCFEHLEIDFDPHLTVLVGINGAGKTAILDALSIMLSTVLREFQGQTKGFHIEDVREIPVALKSRDSVASMDRVFPVSAIIDATLAGKEYWWTRSRKKASGRTSWSEKNTEVGRFISGIWSEVAGEEKPDILLPVIALYGVERLIATRRASGAISRSRAGAYDAALEGQSDLSRLSQFIRTLTLADFAADRRGQFKNPAQNQLEAITLACNEILEHTGWSNPEWNPVPEELTLTHEFHGTLPLSYMSSGIKIATGLVIDLVSRMARANPALGARELLLNVPGIVLIDEIDLHLHPNWQRWILSGLRRVFPTVQFIVTTHSPQVLSTVDAQQIRIIDGEAVRRVEYSAGLRSDIILERILGTSSEPELDINKKLSDYLKLVDAGKGRTNEAKNLRRIIDEEMGGVTNVPKLADADADIAFYDFEV